MSVWAKQQQEEWDRQNPNDHVKPQPERQFQCPRCPISFQNFIGLCAHYTRVHINERITRRGINCPICRRWLDTNRADITTHFNNCIQFFAIRPNNQNRFQCPYDPGHYDIWTRPACIRTFPTLSDLKDHQLAPALAHVRTVTGWKCPKCESRYDINATTNTPVLYGTSRSLLEHTSFMHEVPATTAKK